jgi:nucleoside-diphosphate-sugar epimerase
MNSILIIGAGGLLGNSLVRSFKKKIQVVGALSRNTLDFKDSRVKVHNVDVLKLNLLENVIKKYDVIINCIGQISNPISSCLLSNTIGINNIVSSVKKYDKRLIHISSVSVYGSSLYVDEESDLNPETPYGCSKYFAEFSIKSNLDNYAILRVSNLFGSNQKKGIINYLANSYLLKTPSVNFNNDGSMKRYYLHIDDLVYMIHEVFKNDVIGIYNIVGSYKATIKDLVAIFESELECNLNATYSDQMPLENLDEINCDKVKSIINFSKHIDLKSYIKSLKV